MSQSENLEQVTPDTAQNCNPGEKFVPKTFDQIAAELRDVCARNRRRLRGGDTSDQPTTDGVNSQQVAI